MNFELYGTILSLKFISGWFDRSAFTDLIGNILQCFAMQSLFRFIHWRHDKRPFPKWHCTDQKAIAPTEYI